MERDEYGLLKHFESPHLQAAGIVVSDLALKYSHWTAVESLSEWCAREGVPGITGVDTRAIVTYLREQGSSLARLTVGDEYDADQDEGFVDPNQANLVKQVSTKAPFYVAGPSGSDLHIAVIDCGVKEGILRSLVSRGCNLTVLPYSFPLHQHASAFDGVVAGNGPGDPLLLENDTVYNLARLMETSNLPLFGICLGHQLIGLAAGAKTIKLPYGHRSHNQPIKNAAGRAEISSQNHGFCLDFSTLSDDWRELYVNLNDGTNEGKFSS
jgi:carbamoyl-phosphate synthase small subunit